MSLLPPTNTAELWNWSQEFRAHTAQHAVVGAICLGLMIAACVVGRVLLGSAETEGRQRERAFRHVIGWSILLSQSFIFVRRFTPGQWDLDDSLPFHMCRWTVWIAAWMMLTLDRRARSIMLFWGLGLSTQVFFTPFLDEGHGSMGFWIYWLNHVQIVGVALYDIVVLGFRPNFKDLRFGILTGIGFAALVFVINILLGTNYGYLGAADHEVASLIDKLGPYPLRVVWMVLASAVVMVVMYLTSRCLIALRVRVLKKPMPRFISPDDSETIADHTPV
ncbi:MAG: TIGR02206 family membrane protein [Phycisphaerales bacterium]